MKLLLAPLFATLLAAPLFAQDGVLWAEDEPLGYPEPRPNQFAPKRPSRPKLNWKIGPANEPPPAITLGPVRPVEGRGLFLEAEIPRTNHLSHTVIGPSFSTGEKFHFSDGTLLFAQNTAVTAKNADSAEALELNALTAAQKKEGWKLLFDGKDAGRWWRGYKSDILPAGWVVEAGALVRKGGGGDIITKEQFESFELAIEWKISKGGNSGIMFKVLETGSASYETGPEAQIQDNKDGGDPQKAGWMYALYPAAVDTTKPAGEWNTFRLICQKSAAGTYKCEHHMNGTKYVSYEIGSADWDAKVAKSKFAKLAGFAKAPKGHICLQDHGNEVAFRNIMIRELPTGD